MTMHVPEENLPLYRKIRELVHELESAGNRMSGLGNYALANKMWAFAGKYRREMDKLRVPGKDGK